MQLTPKLAEVLSIIAQHADGLTTAQILSVADQNPSSTLLDTSDVSRRVYNLRGFGYIKTWMSGKTNTHGITGNGAEALEAFFTQPNPMDLMKTTPIKEKPAATDPIEKLCEDVGVALRKALLEMHAPKTQIKEKVALLEAFLVLPVLNDTHKALLNAMIDDYQ